MSDLIIYGEVINNTVDVTTADQDVIHMNSTVDTAHAAAKCASQLSNEYHSVLHRHLAKVDQKVATRFSSLIVELTTLTDATFENVRLGNK